MGIVFLDPAFEKIADDFLRVLNSTEDGKFPVNGKQKIFANFPYRDIQTDFEIVRQYLNGVIFMRWTILSLFLLSFNAVGFDAESIEWTKHPFIATLATSWITSVIACTPFEYSTDNACESLQIKVMKIVRAKPDATTYLASNGEIKAAYLEQALMLLRKEYPNTSDMELAKAILAY